jgi:hypothetical protein
MFFRQRSKFTAILLNLIGHTAASIGCRKKPTFREPSLSSSSGFSCDWIVQVTLQLTVSQSWCRAPIEAHDQILSRGSDCYSMSSCGVLSDDRAGLSFVVCLCLCHVYTYVHLHCIYIATIYILLCIIYTRPLSDQTLYSRLCLP